jgi:nucleoside-diphosphate-sugar epimerase
MAAARRVSKAPAWKDLSLGLTLIKNSCVAVSLLVIFSVSLEPVDFSTLCNLVDLILPSNQSPHPILYASRPGTLPARFRRTRILIVGCGDVGLRVAQALSPGVRLLALTSSPDRMAVLRAKGLTPLLGDLDNPASLRRLAGLAQRIVHLAPPPSEGWRDPRTLALIRALRRRTPPDALVYGSTSGVYGDCGGALVSETRAPGADTPRARRRMDAEDTLRFLGRSAAARSSILRIPGIYAPDRADGTPRARLIKGTPVLRSRDDVYTNHIHADDLARACIAALWRGKPQRVYNVNDNTCLKMGDYFDLAADLYGLTRPPRVPRATAKDQLPLMLLSFMSESRRMDNTRMRRELRLTLRYPSVHTGLLARQA